MALHYRTCGFVIRKTDVGEADRVFTIFTQDFGKIKILGRAIRKIASKLKGGLDINSLSEIEFIQGKTYKTLTDAVIVDAFKSIKRDPLKQRTASKIAKYTDNLLAKEEKDDQSFNLLKTTYSRLNDLDNKQSKIIYFYFIWNFFSVLGYKPELYKCADCQKKITQGTIHFSSADGGMLCNFCVKGKEGIKTVNSDVIKIIKLILKRSWSILEKLSVSLFTEKQLRDISNDYYFHLLSIHLSNSDIIKNKHV